MGATVPGRKKGRPACRAALLGLVEGEAQARPGLYVTSVCWMLGALRLTGPWPT